MGTKHDTENVFDLLGVNNASETAKENKTTDAPKKMGRPKKTEEEKKGGYKFNVNLDRETKTYLKNKAWQDRKSQTDYVYDLIRADMEKYFANGGSKEGWVEED